MTFKNTWMVALITILFAAPTAWASGTVTIGGVDYLVSRVGGAEIPGEFNDPGDFTQPMYLTQAPGDNNTLYIVERTDPGGSGRIISFDPQTNTSSTFLDISGAVVSDGGVLGMAFHPDYQNNGLFYVTTNALISGTETNFLTEYRYTGSGSPTVTRTLLEYASLANNFHTVNWIGFRPGDTGHELYVTTGDGGTQAHQPAFDPALIEDPASPYGKVMRIDLTANFSTPASAPTHAGIEVVSLGHRNPYRASFDDQGGLFIGEIGLNNVEEINYLSAAQIDSAAIEDFGWTAREGTVATPVAGIGGPKGPNDIDPIFDYLHPNSDPVSLGYTGDTTLRGNSVTSGYLVNGRLFFADFVTGDVFSGEWTGNSLTDVTNHTIELETALNDGIAYVTSFSVDNAGNLYIIDFGNSFFAAPGTGEVFKLMTIIDGDLDLDGFVGINDLNIVLSHWNLNVPPADPQADPSGDGFVGIDDLNLVLGNWNAGTPPGGEGSANIPEPSTIGVCAAGALALVRRRWTIRA